MKNLSEDKRHSDSDDRGKKRIHPRFPSSIENTKSRVRNDTINNQGRGRGVDRGRSRGTADERHSGRRTWQII
jgi:hypothetical protein